MLFTELRFVAFFAAVWGVHWALRGNTARKVWLLGASYAFYAAWDWRFLGLVIGSTVLDYVAARQIAAARRPGPRRAWLVASLVGNLGTLALFKYFDFFAASAAALLRALGMEADAVTLGLVLPVGISFYTFQTLSYTLDVYRGTLGVARSPLDLALFVAFLPQLVAGPIVRAAEFLPQVERPRRLADVPVRACLLLFLAGFVKKACIADNVAPEVDRFFADAAAHGPADAWLAMVLYSIQVYCDFSGYSDMAIATAGLLGYRLPDNFLFPYFARSVTDLWRRWHVTLSAWFRDYVYLPLGGSRSGRARTWVNLSVTFLLCGLWHGAAWTYAVWGLVNGAFLLAERAGLGARIAALPRVAQIAYVQVAWIAGLAVFRADGLGVAGTVIARLAGAGAGDAAAPLDPRLWGLVALLAGAHLVSWRGWIAGPVQRGPAWAFAAAYGALVALVLPWISIGYKPFIYFQF